jgi:pyrroline-5-carboxylate reductase
MATTLCHHTLLGSTLYAMETKRHPAVLRNEVTSPAGTTASALYELEDGKFRTVIKDAIWACYRRGLEMGKHVQPCFFFSLPIQSFACHVLTCLLSSYVPLL